MEKDQLREELEKTKNALKRSEEERERQQHVFEGKTFSLNQNVEELRESNQKLKNDVKNLREEKEEFEEELDEKNRQYEYVREQF